jgi:regulator of cell morphogenesis and NO signaling
MSESIYRKEGYAIKVAQVHGDRHNELREIKELVEEVRDEMMEHMVDEENILFRLFKEIVNAKKSNSKLSFGKNKFSEIVMTTEEEHDHVGRAMEKIRALSDNYAIPSDACTSYKLLYKMLEEFENDLFTHIHLENNILFPKAIEIEKLYRKFD